MHMQVHSYVSSPRTSLQPPSQHISSTPSTSGMRRNAPWPTGFITGIWSVYTSQRQKMGIVWQVILIAITMLRHWQVYNSQTNVKRGSSNFEHVEL